MTLSVSSQLRYYITALVVFAVFIWILGDTLLPLILGGAIAYCLDPLADRLERVGVSRLLATLIITVATILIFIVGALFIIPLLIGQAMALFNAAPEIANNFWIFLTTQFPDLLDDNSTIRQSLKSLGETIQSRGGDLINGVVASINSILNILIIIFIVPIVTFYLLLDWNNLISKVDQLVPRDHVTNVRYLGQQIDSTLASFIRGQGTVCTIQGVYYAIALMLAGLNYGIVVGFIAGIVSFIPYVGAVIGGGLAVGLALFQFWGDWIIIGAVALIFLIGQVLEGNFLTPKLVGNSVGLHPVWLILALSVFGGLFGFVGMLLAVPVAAIVGVITKFFLEKYKLGALYRGQVEDDKSNG
jgi:predicted PurR-regulated permease PerM